MLLAILLASIIRIFLVQLYIIPSESMTPTLNVSDRVLVLKDDISNINYGIGEIVVFYHPDTYVDVSPASKLVQSLKVWNYLDTTSQTVYIKRIIGLPGDVIEIDTLGNIYRNNELLIFKGILNETFTNQEKYNVPNDSYFLLGDNRSNSQDSRIFGYVPVQNLIGKAIYVVYPYENIQKLDND
ncbi:signal peptidase I [Candidatus Actinomarina sp.]|nr:signal peptidase I [Candidatus Actinomarina sp.]MDB0017236.1 signal peptidase I [Acidimicrobiia bacterium]MDB3984251.1 signal peptidase I [Acidimicrobiia bacterium]MDC3231188.1 signal peptidase I [Acidimicrobiia bacterium]